MRKLYAIIAALFLSSAQGAVAENVTVVELYTSQGCSSCPPADAMLHDMAKQDDIIALALHVDYWDYIGWKDEFAQPAFTERQKGYARAAGARSVYTPQMIIGGQDHVIGTRPNEVATHLVNHMAKAALVEIETERTGQRVRVRAIPVTRINGEVVVQLVTYRPSSRVEIKRGENAGRTLDYANVVTSWQEARPWSGRGEYTLTASVPTSEPAVIIFQRPDHGEIIGAARLR
ncbi:MAG: DUF1223 domain-containing protein [Pseudomonadota bacterium]